MPKNNYVHLTDGQTVCQTAKKDDYKVVAVRRGNVVCVSRIYPNRYVDETDPTFSEIHPYVQKRCPMGTYKISAYRNMVAESGDLVGAF
jgi:hypothetical protein